jgi:hypothetical protein
MSNQSVVIPESIRKDLESLPGILTFQMLFPHIGVASVDAAYRRYERGTLGVRVRDFGGRLGVLKLDLSTFLATGEPQEQPKLTKRGEPKNPFGRKGKAGRKTNASKGLVVGVVPC